MVEEVWSMFSRFYQASGQSIHLLPNQHKYEIQNLLESTVSENPYKKERYDEVIVWKKKDLRREKQVEWWIFDNF